MQELNDSIMEQIKKNLPEMQVEAITKMYEENYSLNEQLNDSREANQILERSIESKKELVEKKNVEISKLKSKLEVAGDLDKRERDVQIKEINLDKEILKTKLAESNKRADEIKNLFEIPFRNRIVRENNLRPVTVKSEYIQDVYNQSTGETEPHRVRNDVVETKNETMDKEEL